MKNFFISSFSHFTSWCGTHNRAGLQFKFVLKDTPPSSGEVGHTTMQGLRTPLFSNSVVGSFTSHKNQISESAVRRDQRFFVLTGED